MTAIGKMLTFLVLVLSLGWFYLTANAYVARVNWRAEAKRYQDDAAKLRDAAEKANAVILANRDAGADSQKALAAERDRQAATIRTISDNQKDLNALYAAAFQDAQEKAAEATRLQAIIEQLLLEKKNADEKLARNLADANAQTLAVSQAREKQTQAELEVRALRAQNETLREQVSQLQRQAEGRRGGGLAGAGAPPAPRGFRATVTQFVPSRNLAEINQGADAYLERGMELTVSRIDNGDGRFLGTLKLINVDAKVAVGQFTPAAGQARNPANVPKAGDLVQPNN